MRKLYILIGCSRIDRVIEVRQAAGSGGIAGLEGGSHASGQASGQQVMRGGHQGGSKRKSRIPTTANSSHKTGKTNYNFLQSL